MLDTREWVGECIEGTGSVGFDDLVGLNDIFLRLSMSSSADESALDKLPKYSVWDKRCALVPDVSIAEMGVAVIR
jgi:hypothetical protein